MTHTSGPWKIESSKTWEIGISGKDGTWVAFPVGSNEENRQANAELIIKAPEMQDELNTLWEVNKKLSERAGIFEHKNAALLEALEAVEWIPATLPNSYICAWCFHYKHNGHKENCQRQQALAESSERTG
jgi:hypothetical protein